MQLKSTHLQFNNIKVISFFFFVFFNVICFAQKDELDKYIPYSNTNLLTNPNVTLKVKLHLVYRYENDAQNYNLDSIKLIKDQFGWVNRFYKEMSPCTIEAQDKQTHFIPDSRIRFRLDTVIKIVDSVLWDRRYYALYSRPIPIDSLELNKVYLNKRHFTRFNKVDSISINKVNYTISKTSKIGNLAILELTSNVESDLSINELYYYRKRELNCDRYIWEKYTNSDKNAIHIFYTGSSLNGVTFGCGPKPYFLNVTNLINGGGWANAQLVAHELGHTIGLSHTNYPQFDDLPQKDKFGFIPCNNTSVSNNIMGYNQCRNYLSPKQAGYVHQLYTTKPDRIRLTTANEYKAENTLDIWYDTVWNKEMIVTGDIVVRKRQTLRINKNVHLSQHSRIYLEKKAVLIIDGATLTNHFGTKWKGIVICKSAHKPSKKPRWARNLAKVIFKNKGEILEVEKPIKSKIKNFSK